jgi:DNA-binding XRE family transcriptional regulator
MNDILNNLQKYRVWKNITQDQLCKILKISLSNLREIEVYNKYPKYQVRQRICNYFNVSQNQMFYRKGDSK